MKQQIIRKDGIEYERKFKEKKYDCTLNIRIDRENMELLKQIAERKNIRYNALVRSIIQEYISKNK